MSDRSQSKVPLFVLAVGAVLLCAGVLLSVLITVPGIGSRTPPAGTAESGKTARPDASPAREPRAQAEAQSEPLPVEQDEAAPDDPPVTGALAGAPPSAERPAEGMSAPSREPNPVLSESEPVIEPVSEPDAEPVSTAAAEPASEPEPDPAPDTERPAQAETETQAPALTSSGPTAIAEASPHATGIEAPARDHIESHAQPATDAGTKTAEESKPDQDKPSETATLETTAPEPLSEPSAAADVATESDPEASATETTTVETVAPEPSSDVAAETIETPAPETATPSPNEIRTAETGAPDAPPTASDTATSAQAAADEPEQPRPVKSESVKSEPPAPPPPAPTQRAAEQKPEPAPTRTDKPTPSVASRTQSKPGMRPMTLGFGGGLFKPPAKQAPRAQATTPRAYGAAVRAAIGRHKPRAVGARGKATVTFSIGTLGGLRSVGVSRSSGNKQLDQAAIASVRSAAPFPAPPGGSNPTYSLQIYFH